MKSVYRVLALAVAASVFIQAAAIAYAWFQVISDLESGSVLTSASDGNAGHALHGTVGVMVIPLLALALLVVSFFTRIPGAVGRAAVVFGVVLAQVAFAFLAFGVPWIGALHGLNALLLVGASFNAARLVTRADRTTVAAQTARAAA